ncbi:thioredoxin-like protein [Pilobolus umbonatus]|nr:thioredoxin-like protein [Pilobolus umbonatus]
MSHTINIKAVIDTICPWCFIGKRRLEKAIDKFSSNHSDVSFNVEWLPFQLYPHQDKTVDKVESYLQNFGETRFNEMVPYVTGVAAEEGIKLKYGGVKSNSFNSHRLLWWAKKFNKQDEVLNEIFHLYFEDNKDNGDLNELASAAEKAGLNKQSTLDFLKGDEGAKEVRELVKQSYARNIHGVPHFTVNEKYTVSGAQEPDSLVDLFESVLI